MQLYLGSLPKRLANYHQLIVAIVLAFLVLALWLPWGFNISGWGDEWVEMARLSGGTITVSPDRPLLRVSWFLAYTLTPDSFTGVNLVLAGSFLLKGLLFYALLAHFLPKNRGLAFAGAALLIVYPADFAYYNLGALAIHAAVCAYLGAVYMLVIYWQRPRLSVLAGMGLALALCVGTYEVVYPLIAATPVLLLILEKRISRRLILVSALWYSVPLLFLVRLVIGQLGSGDTVSYQSALAAADNSLPTMLFSLVKAYGWHLVTSWPKAIPFTPPDLGSLFTIIAGVITLLSALVMWALNSQASSKTEIRRYGLLFNIGILALGLGFAAYLPSVLRTAYGRTTFYSSTGAVICVVVVMWVITQLPKSWRRVTSTGLGIAAVVLIATATPPTPFAVFVIAMGAVGLSLKNALRYPLLMAGFIGIGTAFHLDQHQTYRLYAASQQPFIQTLVKETRGIKANSVVLVFAKPDETALYETFLWRGDLPGSAFQYIHNRSDVHAFICYPVNPEHTIASACNLQPDSVEIRTEALPPDNGGLQLFKYEQVIAFDYLSDGTLRLFTQLPDIDQSIITAAYQPENRLDRSQVVPARLFSVFGGTMAETTQP